MAGVVVNADSFCNGLDRSWDRFEKRFGLRMKRLVTSAMSRLLARTPVFTGQSVASYRASVGAPSSSAPAPKSKPVEATNKLALGTEALRPSSEAPSRASLNTITTSNPFQTYWIVNKAPMISALEDGLLPYEPLRPRNPAGMFAVTLQELASNLAAGKL